MPARQRLVAAGGGEPGELLGRRGAGRVGGHADAAGGVRRAGHPRGELVAAVAREHEVRVRVDEARDHAPPLRVDPLVRRGARALDGGDEAVLDHQRGVAEEPERALAEGLVVGDEQPDVVDDEAHTTSLSAAATSKRGVAAVADDPVAADHHVADVGGGRGEHRARGRVLGLDARQAHGVERERGEVGERAGLEAAALGPAERGVAAGGRGREEVGRAVGAADAGREPLVELDRARLLERVDDRVGVGAGGERGAGVGEAPRGPDAVGEVALGRRAEADRRSRRAARRPPRSGAWRGSR